MKKILGLFFILSMTALVSCNNGSSSGGGGGFSMNGNWTGQWAGELQTSGSTVTVSGGPLNITLTQNGRQLTGTVAPTNLLDNTPGNFSATISNPNGSGNIELGTIYNDTTSISFFGTYNNVQIYASFGTPSATGSVVKGNLTLTRQ
jgi:hypothetical protein